MYVFSLKFNTGLILSLSLILSACMVGPNFRSPPPPPVKQYTETPQPKKTLSSNTPGGQSQTFVSNKDIPLLWWELYHSPAINSLIKAGLANNPSLAAAEAALREAQENVNVQVGNLLWPAINTSNTATRQRFSTAAIGGGRQASTFNLYNVGFNVSYTLDVFGASRREIESLRAQVDYEQYELIAAYLTLTSNIVTTSVAIASYQAQIDATVALIKVEDNVLNILKNQFRLGGISNADVLTQQTALEQTKATLPPLQNSLSQAKHSLSALIGKFPDGSLPVINLAALILPQRLPISIPSALVRQRPDVLAAEALMHAACAQIGVATANLLPQITLNGNYSWLSTTVANLFQNQNTIWNIAGNLTQPIFQGGALLANRRGKIAAFQQADAQYRQTVLQAFQNVADSIKALEADAGTLKAQASAEQAAQAALKLTLEQYRLGGTNYINLLVAQRQYQQAKINRIQAQAARLSDTAALFQSLGGGWWNNPLCAKECIYSK